MTAYTNEAMRIWFTLGRALFGAAFTLAGMRAFSADAVFEAAALGVPWAFALVPLAGLIAVWGGAATALGWRARSGALLLLLLLAPATLLIRRAPAARGPITREFSVLDALALAGGALVILSLGAGPISVDARRERRRQAHLRPARPSDLSRNLSFFGGGRGRA